MKSVLWKEKTYINQNMRKMRNGNYCGLFVMNKRQKIIGGCQMRFVVFLDIDGVLNTRTTVKRTPYGYTGIDDARVKVLANAIEKCGGGDIVLSSDWKVLDRNHDDYRYLVSKLEQCGLKISDHTIDKERKRGQGVKEYLESHPEIEEFVILDDQKFDFEHYEKIWERLLITNGIERAEFASRTPAVEAILFRDYIKA